MSDKTIYVGNLPGDVREKEVEDIFHKFGEIRSIELKPPRNGEPSSFAFVAFDDSRDAKEAVNRRDGYDFDGKRLRVEFPRGSGPRGPGGRPMRDGGGYRDGGHRDGGYRDGGHRDGGYRDGGHRDGGYRDGGYRGGRGGGGGGFRGARQGGPLRRSNYRLIVEGLPPSGSWQDIKDHLREAGDICYANVENGQGIVEFTRAEDLQKAIRKFDDTKFKSHEGETAYIRLKEDSRSGGDRHRSRSPVARRSRTRSRSPPPAQRRSRSRTFSRSRSPINRRQRSASGSRSPVNRRQRSKSASRSPIRRRDASRSRSPSTRDSSPRRGGSPDGSPRDD